jgi:membrane associated rhomboid family serine protease
MTPAAVGLRCPDHAGKPQGVQKVTRAVSGVRSQRTNLVTLILIGINVAVVVAEFASSSSADFLNNSIYERGALFASLVNSQGQLVGVAHGEWYRLFTAMFLHASFFHIALNMYSLYFVGTIMEQVIGGWRFLLLYVASGIAGSAGALFLSPQTPTVGASGAIFGILGGLLVLEQKRHIASGGQIAGLIVLNLVITFAFRSSISVGGHVGGLIGGAALMWAMLRFRRSTALTLLSAAALVVLSFAVAYSKVRHYQ